MNSKEMRLREDIAELNLALVESKLRITELKKKLAAEETQAIGLKLAKEDLEERLRRHIIAYPIDNEADKRAAAIDADFLIKMPTLMKKV